MGRRWSKLVVAVLFLTVSVMSVDFAFAKGVSVSGGSKGFSGGARVSTRSVSSAPAKSAPSNTKSASSSMGTASKVGFFGPTGGNSAPKSFAWSASAPKPKSAVGATNAYSAKIPPNTQVKQGFMGTSMFDKNAAAQMKQTRASNAKAQLTANTQKFKQAPTASAPRPDINSSPRLASTRVTSGGYNTWSNDRSRYYRDRSWSQPNYVYIGSPSYGMFDALFMWSMLDSINDREQMKLMQSIQNDAEIKQWRAHAEKAAETDPAVMKKLNEMDAKLATLTDPVDPNFKPANIPATVMYSNEVLEALPKDQVVINSASGAANGTYHIYNELLAREGKEMFIFKEVMEPNLAIKVNDFVQGRLDMFAGPVDGINLVSEYQPTDFKSKVHSTIPMYREIMVMISNNNGPTDMSQLDETNIIIPNIKNSGTDLTWKNICQNDPTGRYKSVKVVNMSMANPLDPKEGVLKVLNENKNAVVFYQGGLNSDFMKVIESQAVERKLQLISMNDEDVMANILDATGEDTLYKQVSIPSEKFPNLAHHSSFFGSDVTAYTVDSVLVVSKNWVDKMGPDAYDELVEDSVAIQPYVEKHVNGYEN